MKDLWKGIAIAAICYTVLQLGLKWTNGDWLFGLGLCAFWATWMISAN